MLIRTLSGAALLALLITVISFAPVWGIPIAAALVCALAAHELMSAAGLTSAHRGVCAFAMLFAVLMPAYVYFGQPQGGTVLGLLLLAAGLFIAAMCGRGELGFGDICVLCFSVTLIPYLLCSVIRIIGLGDGDAARGRLLVYIPIIGAFASDTFAYITGKAVGKHKLCPGISPNKTIEGSVGGFIAAPLLLCLYAFAVSRMSGYSVSYPAAVCCGFAAAMAGQLGDLAMSTIKRRCGVKDFGRLIPGHGGVLDRFDSVLFAAPICELILAFLPVIK